MEYNDTSTGEANEILATRLATDRSNWKEKITNLVGLLKEMANLAECQVLMLSYRQILLDKITGPVSIPFSINIIHDPVSVSPASIAL